MAAETRPDPEQVFEGLLHTVGPRVGSFIRCRYEILNEHDIDDILALAVERAWTKYADFDPARGTLEGWFFTLAVRVTLNYLKRRIGLNEVEILTAVPDRAGGPPKPIRSLGESQVYEDLVTIIEALPDRDQAILLGYARNAESGTSQSNRARWTGELAKELGVAPAALRVQFHRLKKKIRREMRRFGHESL